MNRLIVISIFWALAYIGCGVKETTKPEDIQYPIDASETLRVALKSVKEPRVIIYETEPARVIVGYSVLMKNLSAFTVQYNVGADIELQRILQSIANEIDSIDIAALVKEPELMERFGFRLADLLQNGEAAVIDKTANQAVDSILVEKYVYMAHKTAGRGGRRFYLPSRILFLHVLDWMS